MPWAPLKGNKERPSNGRLAFVMLLKEDQEQRVRQIVKEIKDTSGLTKFVGRNAWMMKMQINHKASDSMEIKRIKNTPSLGMIILKFCTVSLHPTTDKVMVS